jgi:hypothetical protein
MKQRKIFAALAIVLTVAALTSIVSGVTPYNMTVRIVNSAGTVINGVASATTAAYNQTVRVVDSSGNVIDNFVGQLTSVGTGLVGNGSAGSPLALATPVSQANGGTGAASLNAANVAQTINTQAGNPLFTQSGLTYGVGVQAWTFTLPQNTLAAFDVMKCHITGDFQNNSGGSQTLVLNTLAGTSGTTIFATSGSLTETSSTGYRPVTVDFTFANDGATNLNTTDEMLAIGNNQGVAGNPNTPAFDQINFSQLTVDTTQAQVFKLTEAIGVATPVATQTPAPTSATTPILHIYSAHCWKLPGTTPTPTATATATATQTQTPTPSPT